MSRFKGRRPSPAMTVACTALIVALAGTAMAAPTAIKSVLNNKEKKQVKGIATGVVNNLAKGLSVGNATNATNATNANNATTATTATNANALGGSSLADIAVAAEGNDASCNPALGAFTTQCVGITITTNRTTDILVNVTGTWHSDDAAGTNVEGDCRIQRDGAAVSATNIYGTENDDTVLNQYERAISISEIDENQPAGSRTYNLACNSVENNFDLEDLVTTAVAVGS